MSGEVVKERTNEPNGGNMYKPHTFMISSGEFWRCAHGATGINGDGKWVGCPDCKDNSEPMYNMEQAIEKLKDNRLFLTRCVDEALTIEEYAEVLIQLKEL